MLEALRSNIKEFKTCLFCDSWEINTENMWDSSLYEIFYNKYGYDIREFIDVLDNLKTTVGYDYFKLISETVINNFYKELTNICNTNECYSRVQCHGSPTNLIDVYSCIDIPKSEVLLYPIHFCRIPASSASLHNKPIVSCETFTCMSRDGPYGRISK